MAFSIDDFDKIWASTSPLTPYTFSESNYKQGWNFVGSTPPSRQMWDSWLKNTDEKMKWLCDHNIGFPVGYEFFSINPNIQDGTLPLLGGEYSREAYASLWEWVQTQTGYLITESAWVSMSNSQGGNVPFYSDGDGSTTFRVPSLKCWIKGKDGAETVGTYLDAGLPNITGTMNIRRGNAGTGNTLFSPTGAYGVITDTVNTSAPADIVTGSVDDQKWSFDASRSNSVYGNSATVQPKSIVGIWLVQAYATVHDAGRIDVKDYIDEQINRRSADFLVGSVQAFAGSTTPIGWLFCDGSAVSRTTYAALFAVIGTSYGAGDGTSTFNVPNMGGRVPIGVGTGTDSRETNTYNVGATGGEYSHQLSVSEMPSHEHEVTWQRIYPMSLNQGGTLGYHLEWQGGAMDSGNIIAKAVGGDGLHNNVQPYLALNYIIKY